MNMKEYLELSAKTIADPKINYELLENDTIALSEAMEIVNVGTLADAMKRTLFYADPSIEERVNEANTRISNLLNTLDETNVILTPEEINLFHGVLGLASEAAEILEELIQAKVENREVNKINGKGSIKEEAGDVMWYLAVILRFAGITFEEAGESNISKLKKRYPNQFNTTDAVNRNLEEEGKALTS